MGGFSLFIPVSLQILLLCNFIILIFHIICDWSMVTCSCRCVWLCLLSSCQCSIRPVQPLEKWTGDTVGASSFLAQIHILDEIRLHSTACSTQRLLQLSVPPSCLVVVKITSWRTSLEQEGSNLWQVWHSPDIFSSWMDLHGLSGLPVGYNWSQTSKWILIFCYFLSEL